MKRQILTQKISMLIFTALLFIYVIHGVSYAELEFTEGEATTREIAEDAAIGTNVGDPLRFTSDTCTRFRIRGPDASSFDLERVFRGVQLKTKTTLDYETKDSYEVRIIIAGAWSSDTITVTINIIDVNEAPMFSEAMDSGVNRIQRSVPENTAVGTNIGDPVSAIDPDEAGDALTYSLNSSNADMFEIDSGTGQLRTKTVLDYEAFDSEPRGYATNVHASDGEMFAETEVWVNIEPVNEFTPMFVEGDAATREIHEKEDVGANVGEPVSATDRDMGDVLEYSLTDIDPDVFEINSSTGQLRTVTALDYKTKPSYTAKVLVSDGSRVASITVTIQVLTDDIEGGTAPAVHGHKTDSLLEQAVLKTFNRDVLQVRLQGLYTENDRSVEYLRAIMMLENLLASMRPDKTQLLANYPNPFNPETWIPYHLAKSTDVQITIYDAHGIVVQHLELGHQSAGYYTSRSQAAYWDGRNDFGEHVASGIYFYQMQADTISPLRKMIILK